jgi:AraC family transcriptional regulator
MPKDTKFGIMGICMNDFDEKTKTFSYVVGIERPDEAGRAALPSGCVEFVVPAATWAVFPAHGPMPNAIQDVWKRIYAEWYPRPAMSTRAVPNWRCTPPATPAPPTTTARCGYRSKKAGS